MNPSLKERLVFYKFSPKLELWHDTDCKKSRTFIKKLYEETWYGEDGKLFHSGYFIIIQFKFFTIHIRVTWWQLHFRGRGK